MGIVVAPNTNPIKGGVLTGCATNLGHGLKGVLEGRTLSRSFRLPTTTTKVIGTPWMVFTNLIMIIHVNRIVDRPLMNSMVVGRCRNTDAMYLRGGY